MTPGQEISDGGEAREKNAKNVPRVEKDNTNSLSPWTEWAFLCWVIAFSTLSGVTLESILPFVTVKREAECRHAAETSYTDPLSKVPHRYAGNLPSARMISKEEWQISLCVEVERYIRHSISGAIIRRNDTIEGFQPQDRVLASRRRAIGVAVVAFVNCRLAPTENS